MSATETSSRSVIVEKDFPHPPEKVWRALSQSDLIEQWLLKNDFHPVVGHSFKFRREPMPNWDGVIDCQVVTVDPCKTLSYTWGALGLGTVVTFTLTRTETGTHLRMEQSGFGPGQERNFNGAKYGWQSMINGLEQVLAGLE